MKYCGPRRALLELTFLGCWEASLTASYRLMLPAFGVPGAAKLVPWLIVVACVSWVCSWLSTVLPFGVSALASQS